MLRDLMITTFYRVGADIVTAQFLTGHGIDANRYLQITKTPERPEREWQKYRQFLDSGITTESQERIAEISRDYEELKGKIRNYEETISNLKTDLSDVRERLRSQVPASPHEHAMRLLESIPVLVQLGTQGELSLGKSHRKHGAKNARVAQIINRKDLEAGFRRFLDLIEQNNEPVTPTE
jgi:hypothetical protein